MLKFIVFITAFISMTAQASNQFCGSLGTVRSGYAGEYYVSSLVLYNGSVANDSATAYNDKYLNIRNDDNSVTNGFDTVDLIERIFFKNKSEQIVDYAWEQQALRDLKIEVCLYDFKISTRNNNGRVEARANDAKEIKISFNGKVSYAGDIAKALEYLRKYERMVAYQIELDAHQKIIDQLKLDIDAIPAGISDQLK